VLISLWIFLFPAFLFAAQPKEFFLGGLKKLEQRSHKCVELLEEICRVNANFFNPVAWFLYKAKDLSTPLVLFYLPKVKEHLFYIRAKVVFTISLSVHFTAL
jgi:hypothetical protein